MDFDKEFYMATLRTAHAVGMEVIPMWKAAWLMAIVTVFGNNEGFTLSPKFHCDMEYIQETYHIQGAEHPDDAFVAELREYMAKCEAVKDDKDPFFQSCASMIRTRYNFPLYC